MITVLPAVRISYSALETGGIEKFINLFFTTGTYYFLPIIGFAGSILLSKAIKEDQEVFQFNVYIFTLFIFGILFGIRGIFIQFQEGGVGIGYSLLANIFIPVSAIFLSRKIVSYQLFGLLNLTVAFIFSSLMFARSYLLVSFFLLGSYVFFIVGKNIMSSYGIPLIVILFLIVGLLINNYDHIFPESVINDFYFDSLFSSFSKVYSTGNLEYLLAWEGNSRGVILINAFYDFSTYDWWIGKGVLAKYKSFVERSTIEMGWAQDLFRFGLFYVLIVQFIFIKGWFLLRNIYKRFNASLFYFLASILLIRYIDGFIYGMPEFTLYNFIVFSGVMLIFVKKKYLI